MPNNYK